MSTEPECGGWNAVKGGNELLVYGVCTARRGRWSVTLVADNPGVVPDATSKRLKTRARGGGSTTVMSYFIASRKVDGPEVTKVFVNGTKVRFTDLTPRV